MDIHAGIAQAYLGLFNLLFELSNEIPGSVHEHETPYLADSARARVR